MKVIVAPLNWGIGHATRMIPLIELLRKHGAIIHLASDGDALAVLKSHFPLLPSTELPSYNIKYKHSRLYKNSFSLIANMLRAIPAEQKVISKLADEWNAEMIISDNRFGCHSTKTINIFVTHQLNILAGTLPGKFVNWTNRRLMKKFDEIWVPDYPNEPNLAGKLSQAYTPNSVKYIGCLSRFEMMEKLPKEIDILAILSGPEPQRTFFEQKLQIQFAKANLKTLIVRGKPHDENLSSCDGSIDFASTDELSQLIARSRVIISRSGYSTIMDYEALGVFSQVDPKIIFIPTPGQPEQIYLAEKMAQQKLVYTVTQQDFDLPIALRTIGNLKTRKSVNKIDYLSKVVVQILGQA